MPQQKLPMPMVMKSSVIASEISVRDQPVAADIGARNTGNEKIDPMATQPMKPPAATMTQRYGDCIVASPSLLVVTITLMRAEFCVVAPLATAF